MQLPRNKLKRWIIRQVVGPWTFVKYEDLVNLSRAFADQLRGHDCVVGIPRVGLIVAGVVSNRLGLPLFTPETLPRNKFECILLIDDGCCSNHGTMARIAEKIKPKTKAAIFTGKEGANFLDKYMWLVNSPMLYEWDLFHTHPPYIDDKKAFDIDGVLCCDPTSHLSTLDFALNAEPYMIPNYKIGSIITGRPEYLMGATRTWLQKHGVEFDRLISTENKVKTLLEVSPSLYYESDYETALILAKRTHIPIVAVDRMELLYE